MHVSYTEPRDPCPSSREFSSFGIRMYISLLRICEISESWNEHRTSSGWPRFLIPVQIIGWFVIIIDSSNRNHALPPGTWARSVSIACMSIPSLHQSRNPYLDSKRSRDARTRPVLPLFLGHNSSSFPLVYLLSIITWRFASIVQVGEVWLAGREIKKWGPPLFFLLSFLRDRFDLDWFWF